MWGGKGGGGTVGTGRGGVGGVKLGALKLKPQASQNWPVLGVPQRGQGSAGVAAGSGQGYGPVAPGEGPWPPAEGPVPAADGPPAAADRPVAGLPPMRMPHTSQKSSLAESCPLGHTAI